MAGGPPITWQATMGEILAAYPAARVALFQRFHIGGCQACGYALTDTLGQVREGQQIDAGIDEWVDCIRDSAELEARLHIGTAEAARQLSGTEPVRLLDVRLPAEFRASHIRGAELLTVELTFEALDSWDKDTLVLTYSTHGRRSLDKASYLTAYGLRRVRSIDGGLEAWRAEGRDWYGEDTPIGDTFPLSVLPASPG